MGKIKGIHHVALKCSTPEKYEETVAFYRDVLELPVVRTWAAGTMLDTGAGLMEIFSNGVDMLPQGNIRHFALATDDVDGCAEAVKAAGYEVFVGPKEICIPSEPPYPARMAFCRGPLGEEIEFFCAHE